MEIRDLAEKGNNNLLINWVRIIWKIINTNFPNSEHVNGKQIVIDRKNLDTTLLQNKGLENREFFMKVNNFTCRQLPVTLYYVKYLSRFLEGPTTCTFSTNET